MPWGDITGQKRRWTLMSQSQLLTTKMRKYLNMEDKQILPAVMEQATSRFKTVMESQFGVPRAPRDEKEIKLYPSESGKCERAIFYKALGIPGEPFQADTRLKFSLGDMVELQLIYILGHSLKSPDSVYDNNVIREIPIGRRSWRGATDGIVKIDGVRRNLEVKSASSYGFKATKRKGVDDAFGYLTQACVYTRYLMKEKLIDVPETVFLYVDRDSMHLHEETVRFEDWGYAEEADAKFNHILDCIEAKKKPKRPYDLERGKLGLACRYCAHKYTCWVQPHQAVTFDENANPVYQMKPTQYLHLSVDRGKPNWILIGDK